MALVPYICSIMNVYNDLNKLPAFRNAVVTIGSFDGVHRGHQEIIQKVNALARSVDGESIVITFHPHPRLVVYPNDSSLRLITTIDEKVQLLEKYGVDNVVVVPFTIEFSQQSADEYIQKFLVDKFHPKYIVIGYDHRFGLARQGDIHYLRHHGEKSGYKVIEIPRQDVHDIAVSSTKIREALQNGKMREASRLMGHPFMLSGTVVHGQKIGSTIGFPTANLDPGHKHKLIPPPGIFAVKATHQDTEYQGMLYIGDRPTIKEHSNQTIEVNLFDFDRQIYGDRLKLEIIERVRDDASFGSLDALSKQLAKDKEASLKILAKEESEQQRLEEIRQQPHVAIVILNYNGREYLEKFLPSVLATAYTHLSVIVADNASTDESVAFMKKAFPDVQLIQLKENHGFAEGYNQALAEVKADYFVLLNSDVEVTPNWLQPMIDLMERDETVAACQPKILDYNRREYFEYAGAAGGWIDRYGYPLCRGRIFGVTEKDEGQYNDTQEIFWATGAAFCVRAKLFRDIGGFDKDYFAHSEEIDLCWRLKRAGFKIMVRPRSVVYHVGGGTLSYNTPRKVYLNFRNSLFTILKNEARSKTLWLIPFRFILDGLAGVLFMVQGKFPHIRAIIDAHQSYFKNYRLMLRKRKELNERIQKISIDTRMNDAGRYKGSIVWKYYARGVRYFKHL